MIVAMNESDVMVDDDGNSYLNAKPRERPQVKRGPVLFWVEYADRYANYLKDSKVCMNEIVSQFRMKEDSIDPTDIYLDINISKCLDDAKF